MALTNVIEKEDIIYVETIEGLTPEVVQLAMKQFEDYKAKGVIISGSFHDLEWELTNEVQKRVRFKFAINALHYYEADLNIKLGCSYDACLLALHSFAVLQLNHSLGSVCQNVRSIVKFINSLKLSDNYHECSAVRDFLEILPEYTPYIEDIIDATYSKADSNSSSKKKIYPRELKKYQSYFRFDHYLSIFWKTCTEEERILFFPVWLWWSLTSIIPLRVAEFILTPRNCIRSIQGELLLSLRRTKQKAHPGTAHHNIPGDYELCEYPVPSKMAESIQWYINVTSGNYRSDIDTLFCKTTQFVLSQTTCKNDNHYTPENLRALLAKFYRDIFVGRYGLRLVNNDTDGTLGENEIEFIRPGDTRHIACIGLMVVGNDVTTVKELARHSDIQTGANYYSSVTKFMDALILEHFNPKTDSDKMLSIFPNSDDLLADPRQYEEVTGGRCTSSKYKNLNFSHCASAVSPNGKTGVCEYCSFYFPDSYMLSGAKRDSEQQLQIACSILSETLLARNDELGFASLRAAFERLQAAEAQYLKISAIERLYKER